MRENVILDKSFAFSVRMVRAYRHLSAERREYILSKQLLRSATSIGANVHEANNAHGKKDFIAKMYIAYKEATENGILDPSADGNRIFHQGRRQQPADRLCGIEADFNRDLKKRKGVGIIHSAFCILHSALSGGG